MVVGLKILLSNILGKITVHEVANTVKQPVQRDDVFFYHETGFNQKLRLINSKNLGL